MQKIVIVKQGIFGLSTAAEALYARLSGRRWPGFNIARDDPFLVEVVTRWGRQVTSQHTLLEVVTIPDGVQWQIDFYDGARGITEWVAEKHRTWGCELCQ